MNLSTPIIDHFHSYHFVNISVFPCFVFFGFILRYSLSLHLYKMLSIISLADEKKKKNCNLRYNEQVNSFNDIHNFFVATFSWPRASNVLKIKQLAQQILSLRSKCQRNHLPSALILQFVKTTNIATSIATSIATFTHIFQTVVDNLSAILSILEYVYLKISQTIVDNLKGKFSHFQYFM